MKSITMKISLLSEFDTYCPGDVVKGSVNLSISHEVIISRVSVKLIGVAVINYKGKDPPDQELALLKKETYVEDEKYLYSSQDGNLQDLFTEAGNHELPFTFVLPDSIPSSFESKECYIRYTISSSLEGAKLPLLSEKVIISVNAPLDLNNIPKSQYPSTAIIDQKNNTWCWCAKTTLHAGVHTSRRGYVPGEIIILNAEINNLDSKPVVSVRAQLIQIIKYYHKAWPRKTKRMASEITRGYILPNESQYWMGETLIVPALVSSYMKYCNLIDIKYKIYFRIAKAGVPEIIMKLPIIIGNVPLMGCVDVLSDAIDAEERSIATLERATKNHEPCHFGPHDVTESNSENVQDQCLFSPRYITYSS
ncbi:hypothetical protein R5R35_010200 [Gryllus longicercus]|uniref:Arrestin C-terminal-like domain-containing protein n=1 Tax=Gryllus longicercus TaxID=2509291 RepID=A0AAN9W166_9ORTH